MRGYIVLIMIFMLSSIAIAASDSTIYVRIDSDTSPTKMTDIIVYGNTDFPDPRIFEEDESVLSDSVKIVLEDSSGKVITVRFFQGQSVRAIFNPEVNKIKLLVNNVLVDEKDESFCNNNGICEPCQTGVCTVNENYLTCSDCSSGSADGFCDTIKDGICDPDCDYDTADPDCESLCDENCYAEEYAGVPSCAAFGGTICSSTDKCLGGELYYTSDTNYCCIDGFCAMPSEYVETKALEQSQPLMTINPLGEMSTPGENYCTDKLAGILCANEEYCSGKSLEYSYKNFCCLDSCLKIPEEQIYPPDQDKIGMTPEELMIDLNDTYAEQVAQRYESNISNVSLNEFDEMYAHWGEPIDGIDPIAEREVLEMQVYEEQLNATQGQTNLTNPVISKIPILSSLVPAAGIDYVYIVGGALLVLLVVVLLVFLFRRKASSDIAKETPPEPSLQNAIDVMASRGYDYKAIREYLLKEGYPQSFVDSEIMKNYNSRKGQA